MTPKKSVVCDPTQQSGDYFFAYKPKGFKCRARGYVRSSFKINEGEVFLQSKEKRQIDVSDLSSSVSSGFLPDSLILSVPNVLGTEPLLSKMIPWESSRDLRESIYLLSLKLWNNSRRDSSSVCWIAINFLKLFELNQEVILLQAGRFFLQLSIFLHFRESQDNDIEPLFRSLIQVFVLKNFVQFIKKMKHLTLMKHGRSPDRIESLDKKIQEKYPDYSLFIPDLDYDAFPQEDIFPLFEEDCDDFFVCLESTSGEVPAAILDQLPKLDLSLDVPQVSETLLWFNNSKCNFNGNSIYQKDRILKYGNPRWDECEKTPFEYIRRVVAVSPGNFRDTWIGKLENFRFQRFYDQLIGQIVQRIPQSGACSDSILERRIRRMKKYKANYFMLDLKKAGLTIPHYLISSFLDKLEELTGISFSRWGEKILNQTVICDDDRFRPQRGFGLGMGNNLMTLINICIITSLNLDCLVFSDDIVVHINSVEDINNLISLYRQIGWELSIEKVFLADFFVFLESYHLIEGYIKITKDWVPLIDLLFSLDRNILKQRFDQYKRSNLELMTLQGWRRWAEIYCHVCGIDYDCMEEELILPYIFGGYGVSHYDTLTHIIDLFENLSSETRSFIFNMDLGQWKDRQQFITRRADVVVDPLGILDFNINDVPESDRDMLLGYSDSERIRTFIDEVKKVRFYDSNTSLRLKRLCKLDFSHKREGDWGDPDLYTWIRELPRRIRKFYPNLQLAPHKESFICETGLRNPPEMCEIYLSDDIENLKGMQKILAHLNSLMVKYTSIYQTNLSRRIERVEYYHEILPLDTNLKNDLIRINHFGNPLVTLGYYQAKWGRIICPNLPLDIDQTPMKILGNGKNLIQVEKYTYFRLNDLDLQLFEVLINIKGCKNLILTSKDPIKAIRIVSYNLNSFLKERGDFSLLDSLTYESIPIEQWTYSPEVSLVPEEIFENMLISDSDESEEDKISSDEEEYYSDDTEIDVSDLDTGIFEDPWN